MAKKLFGLIALCAVITPSFALSEKAPLVLKPSSAWHVDYADERCRLARTFGEGDEQVFIVLDRYGPDQRFKLVLAGKPMKTSFERGDVTVQFGPEEQEQKLDFLNGYLDKTPAIIVASSAGLAPISKSEINALEKSIGTDWRIVAPISDARKKAIKYIKIGKPLRQHIQLESGSLHAATAQLDKCVDNLMTRWGIDTEKHKTLTSLVSPTGSPGDWIDTRDYPPAMVRQGQGAIVDFRLSVDTSGVSTACYIQSTTRPKEFDEAVCRAMMRRARFKPALDADGKPIASFYQNSIRFVIPVF